MGDEVYSSYAGRVSPNLVEQLEEGQHPRVAGIRSGVPLELLKHLPEAEPAAAAILMQTAG